MTKVLFLKSIFALVAFACCFIITFRPIPGTTSRNDTGRYVENQREACKAHPFQENGALPTKIFDLIARPACLTGSSRTFLLLNSLSVPIAIVLFTEWNSDAALLLAWGLLFSAVSFELMTNALRQAASITFLLAAFRYEKRVVKILAVLAALLLHDSSWVFAPLVFVINGDSVRFHRSPKILVWILPCAAAAGYIFWIRFLASFGGGIGALYQFYTLNYDQDPSFKFALFAIFPLAWLVLVRLSDGLIPSEKLSFWYSAVILLICMVFFPYITYRFALTAVVVQAAIMLQAKNLSVKIATYAALGLIAHLMAYAFIGKNVMDVFNG